MIFFGPRVLYKTHLPINRTRGKCGQKGAVYSCYIHNFLIIVIFEIIWNELPVSNDFVLLCLVGGRYSQDQVGLRIRNITRADNGRYLCRAEVPTDGRYDEKAIDVTVYSMYGLSFRPNS